MPVRPTAARVSLFMLGTDPASILDVAVTREVGVPADIDDVFAYLETRAFCYSSRNAANSSGVP